MPEGPFTGTARAEGPIAGKAALITAGGTGIGYASARRLLEDGVSVTIAARREDVLALAAERLRSEVPDCPPVGHVVCDVTDEAQVAAAVQAAAEPTGALHFVVASAGMGSLGPLHKTSLDEWRAVLDTNLTGTFLTFKHATPVVVASGGGSMVAISSTAGAQLHAFLGAYGVTKAGIDMLVTHFAEELGAYGVRVNSIRPGAVATELMEIPLSVEPLVDDYLEQMPVSRIGTPEDVAEAVRFMLGPESSWITGIRLDIDGGMHIRRGASYEHLARAFFGDEGLEDMKRPATPFD
jgi:NAD(P)-dependent dehydrogenase (short-subunit alcohol dehydrogenase family)